MTPDDGGCGAVGENKLPVAGGLPSSGCMVRVQESCFMKRLVRSRESVFNSSARLLAGRNVVGETDLC